MRRAVLVIASVLGLGLATGAFVIHRAVHGERPGGAMPVDFVVPEGATLDAVARAMVEAGLVDRAWKLKLAARLGGGDRAIRAGEYRLDPGASAATLLETLCSGRQRTRAVTLPEGRRLEWTVAVLADSLGLDPERLRALAEDPLPEWRERLGLPEGRSLEGYLYPETYRFVRGLQPATVVETLLRELQKVLVDSVRVRMQERRMDLHRVLTLASIVEAEATVDHERPKVAAVYLNRLREGWKLEADPTVAYALGKEGQRLTYGDLQTESAYNTYRNPGLPPGPINSPGRASILAVLWPEPGFDAMYFVADGAGGHRFSRTWPEHREAVRQYRRARDGGSG